MRRYSTETIVGVFVVVGLICVGYMTIKLGKLTFFGQDTYPLYARFTSVTGLRAGSPVEVYGIEAGSVTSLEIDEQKEMAVVGMRIDRRVKVYEDSTATIKTAGLIGDKYVRIDPGGAGPLLEPRGVITQTSVPPDIEDLIGKYAFGDVGKGTEKQGK
ncbi:MAG TPA: outer membrane lipid asymmetry maintenance protein MlaD [Syntrophorhabdales bacterium]|nr:outer membrane lipid asymmetry maintenance protein MlaD [Syntrophorhabdales bacterium]